MGSGLQLASGNVVIRPDDATMVASGQFYGGGMTTALITGGAGFIGSHLAEVLLQRGWTVEVLDDLSTGSIKNVTHLKTHAGFSYVLDSRSEEHTSELQSPCNLV